MQIEVKEPFPQASIPRVWAWIQAFRGRVLDDYGPQTLEAFVDYMRREMTTQRTWGVYRDGELVGMISFQPLANGIGTAHCLFKKDGWGRAVTLPAVREAVGQMFAGDLRKLTLYVLEGNAAMGDLLAQLGARREGTLRAQTMRGGKPCDMWLYGLLKSEFKKEECDAISGGNTSGAGSDRRRVCGNGRPDGGGGGVEHIGVCTVGAQQDDYQPAHAIA